MIYPSGITNYELIAILVIRHSKQLKTLRLCVSAVNPYIIRNWDKVLLAGLEVLHRPLKLWVFVIGVVLFGAYDLDVRG